MQSTNSEYGSPYLAVCHVVVVVVVTVNPRYGDGSLKIYIYIYNIYIYIRPKCCQLSLFRVLNSKYSFNSVMLMGS